MTTAGRGTSTSHRLLWAGLLAALAIVPNLFALRQLHATGGFLFYTGAFDETTYLSYEGAMATRSFTHLGEYVVVLLQNVGLSGGTINLLFDLALPTLTVVVLRGLARSIGFARLDAVVYPLAIIAIPVLVGSSDPYYARLYNLNVHSRGLTWLVLPQAYYPPFFRSPEPQLSLFACAAAVALAVRVKSYLPPFIVAPLLYPFVGIPLTFVTLCLALTDRRAPLRLVLSPVVAALTAFVAIAATIGFAYVAVVRDTDLADYLPHSRLPLISGTGTAALAVYALARRRLPQELRGVALFLALAPTAVVNTQLVTGFFETPHNFEQCFGVVALAIVLVFALRTVDAGPWLASATAAASCALLALYSAQVFRTNSALWQRVPPPPALLDALSRDPESVVIADPDLADLFSLIAPRIRFSALARSQIVRSDTAAERFDRYLCTRDAIRRHDLAEVPAATFALLDAGFRYLGQDFPLVHLNRDREFRQYFDPDAKPRHCDARPLLVFPSLIVSAPDAASRVLPALATDGRWQLGSNGTPVVTPPAQWAYAATARLPPVTLAAGGAREPLADVRARLTVDAGCLGIGLLTHDRDTFIRQIRVTAAAKPQTADVPFAPDARGHWLAVFNCSPHGESKATIDSIDVLRIDGVSVRTVATGDRSASDEP